LADRHDGNELLVVVVDVQVDSAVHVSAFPSALRRSGEWVEVRLPSLSSSSLLGWRV
jgi:hypothetical protein